MTTTVKVQAHCAPNVEVRIIRESSCTGEEVVIQNGEEWEGYVYDNYFISVREVPKQKVE
jgi:hypothetical protein